jgi:hypothetical protein
MVEVTVQSLYEASERLERSPKPNQADFMLILSAANSGSDEQALAAQLVARHATLFPNLMSNALSFLLGLVKSSDVKVRRQAIKELPKFLDYAKADVTTTLLALLGESDQSIVITVTPPVVHRLKDDQEFRAIYFRAFPNQSREAQNKMIKFIREEIIFTQETIPQLIEFLNSALQSHLTDALRLLSRNKTLLGDHSHAIIDGLLDRFDATLSNQVDDSLIELFPLTPIIGDDGTRRLLSILSNRVLPQFDKLPVAIRIATLQKISDLARSSANDTLLKQVYSIFLSFPTPDVEKPTVNFSVVEAALSSFLKLAKVFPRTASQLIGTLLVLTGQPDEYEHATEDPNRKKEFTDRLDLLEAMARGFMQHCDNNIEFARSLPAATAESEEEKRGQIKEAMKAKRTGNNCLRLCKILKGKNPLVEEMPKVLSWQKPTK